MFARVFTLLPLALVVSASHLVERDQCSTENQNCCNSVQSLSQANTLLTSCGLVDAAAVIGGLVGVNCSPITAIGLGGNSCTQQAVCCTNNDFNGLVNLGCTPINLNA